MSEQLLREILSEVRTIKSDVAELKSDVAVLKSDVAMLKSDVAMLKSDVAMLKIGQAELKEITTALRHAQEVTNAKLDALTKDVRQLEGTVESMRKDMTDWKTVKYSVDVLNRRQLRIEAEFEQLRT